MLDEDETTDCEILVRSSHRVMEALVKRHPHDVIISSPYLSAPVAPSVVKRASRRTAVVLTTFDAETFLSRASSLEIVRELVADGYDVRGVDGLHAKLVLAGDSVALGSQNLTLGGIHNLEATVLIRDAEVVGRLRNDLTAWIGQSFPITLMIVDTMEAALEALREQAEVLGRIREKGREIDRLVRSMGGNQADVPEPWPPRSGAVLPSEAPGSVPPEPGAGALERSPPLPEPALSNGDPPAPPLPEPPPPSAGTPVSPNIGSGHGAGSPSERQGGRDLRTAVRESRPVREAVAVRVVRGKGEKATLAPRNPLFDLTKWELRSNDEAQPREFVRGIRCLVVAPETRRIAWPTLYKTRLSNFSNWTPPTDDIRLLPVNHRIRVETRQEDGSPWNVQFKLVRPDGRWPITVLADFAPNRLDIVDVVGADDSPILREHIRREASDPESTTRRALLDAVFRQFEHDSQRMGDGAAEFCRGLPDDLVLRIRRAGDRMFFSVETPEFDREHREVID